MRQLLGLQLLGLQQQFRYVFLQVYANATTEALLRQVDDSLRRYVHIPYLLLDLEGYSSNIAKPQPQQRKPLRM